MIRDFTELCRATYAAIKDMTPDGVHAAMQDRTSECYRLGRLFRRYARAKRAAGKFGFIGVGAISYAERRMMRFQYRTRM